MKVFCTEPHEEQAMIVMRRIREAEHAEKQAKTINYILESAAINVIRKYDPDAVDEFRRLVEEGKREHSKPFVSALAE